MDSNPTSTLQDFTLHFASSVQQFGDKNYKKQDISLPFQVQEMFNTLFTVQH
jgi:hypothetical protein